MIVDQLFTPKPLKEGGPYDLPGKDYDRPGDTPRRPRGEHNPYPYSKEEDDDHFREIFRKKREAAKKAEQSKLAESMLLEDPVYRNFKVIGRYIAERKLTEPEILKVFADAEAGMTDKATGANRTFLGRGKDTTMDFAGGVADALKGVWSGIQSSTPISLVDVAYDKATDAMADLTGGQKGAVMQAINKYRMLAKEYPKTAGLAKGALVAITGLATGGAGLPAVAALVYGLDSAIKGEKFSDIALKAGGAAATAWAASKLASAFGSQPAPSDASAGSLDAADQVYQGAGGGASGANVPVDGGTYTVMQGDQGGFIAQAQGVPFKDLEAMNPQITNWNKLPVGTELQLPPSGPNTGSVWQGYTGNNTAGPELLGGPSAGDVASPVADVAASAAVPAPSPLNLQPAATPGGPQFGTVTLPDGQTLKAAAFPEGGGITPRLPVGSTPVTINYNGQELTGRIVNDTVYFTKFPADAAAGTTASTAGTLSGVTGQQIASSPVYQQVYAQEIAKYGAEPSARAIQTAQQIATLKAKAAMAGAVQEATEFTRTVKMRQLPVDKLIDQKLTTMSWALNESVGKPQGRSMHLTPLGVYTVFENIRRVGEAAATATRIEPTFEPIDEYPPEPFPVPPRPAPTPKPAPTAPVNTTPTGPGREELPDLYRPDAPDAPYTPADPAKKSWFGKGLDYLDKGVKKVGGVIGNLGHQLTTGVTKEKLKMNWHVAGKPSDSDQLSAWLVKQGVPIGVVNGVYEKMGLPVSAEPTTPTDPAKAEPQAKTGGAQKSMSFYGNNPTTGKAWTYDELQAKANAGKTPAADTPTDTAATDTTATNTAPAPTATKTTAGGGAGFNAGNVFKLPGMEKYAKPAATPPAKTPNFAGPSGYGKTTMSVKPMAGIPGMKTTPAPAPTAAPAGTKVTAGGPTADEKSKLDQRIAQALKAPVAEMLQMVETKEDVQRIKQFVDQTFTKYGAVNESAFAIRNQILEHVTQVGAQRRREHSRKAAH